PGTETCLKLGGYIRYDIDFAERTDPLTGDKWGWRKNARGHFTIDAREETEYGTLRGFIAFQGNANGSPGAYAQVVPGVSDPYYVGAGGLGSTVGLDEAFIELGGLKIGYAYDVWDNGIVGEGDSLGSVTRYNMIAYTYTSGGWHATLELLDDNSDPNGRSFAPDFMPHVAGEIGATFGPVDAAFVAGYDNITDEAAFRLIVGADLTANDRLELAGIYATGRTVMWNQSEWAISAGLSHTFNAQWTVQANAQYWGGIANLALAAPDFTNADGWRVGANVDWKPTPNFLVRVQAYYHSRGSDLANGIAENDFWTGRVRFQRSF
ncbi:MAG: porin, partial [Caldilineaceae bacterium]|nr:porin [Caldilineaceae bacterium]